MKNKLREVIRFLVLWYHKVLFSSDYKRIVNLLEPNFFLLKKINLGKVGDGTYILPSNFINNNTTLISLGIADDTSFEEDFLHNFPNSIVYAFDPSINFLPKENNRIIFESKGVAGIFSSKKEYITLESILNKLPNKTTDIILKMDIEGWEWGIFEKTNLNKYNIPVIVIEFHFTTMNSFYEWLFFPYFFYIRYKTLKKVLNKYYIMHMHANNYGYTFFDNFTFPWLCEMTLIKKDSF